jgi:hypothetical protein
MRCSYPSTLITTCLYPAGAAGFELATAAVGSSPWACRDHPWAEW